MLRYLSVSAEWLKEKGIDGIMGKTNNGGIAEAIQTLARRMRRFSAHHGDHVNRLERLLLLLLLLDNDAISMRDLASLLDIRLPSLSQWLDRLVEEGEVTRKRDEDDKRVVHISLTEKGLKLARVSEEKVSSRKVSSRKVFFQDA